MNFSVYVLASGSRLDDDGTFHPSSEFTAANPQGQVKGDDSLTTCSTQKFVDNFEKMIAQVHPKKKDSPIQLPYFGFGVVCDEVVHGASYLSLVLN